MALKAVFIAAAFLRPGIAMADPIDRWASEIVSASERFGVPQSWIRRVMRAESGGEALLHGRPIVSSTGAMGLMQLMPGTWSDMRALLGLGSDPHDPHDNIFAGTAYLRLMYDRFGYPGLFAAYNAGPGRYAASLSGERRLPAETRTYIAAVSPPKGAVTAPRPTARIFAVTASSGPPNSSGRQPLPSFQPALFVELSEPRPH
jgi:soluble lytic murein transglycosylase-like protein